MKALTNEQQKSYENAKICYICKEKSEDRNAKDKKYRNLEIIIIKQLNMEVMHMAYVI